jgi:hypothetical protein
MVAALRELFAKSRHPSQEDKESAAQMLSSILEQAQAIGHAHATDEVERAIAWGGKFQNVLSSAWNIVTNFVNRIAQWFAQQEATGEDITEQDIEDKIDSLAETVAGVEVAAAIEEDVQLSLYLAGVALVKSIAQPGACKFCLNKAAADPVPIDEFEPPPYHSRCRCSTAPADEE